VQTKEKEVSTDEYGFKTVIAPMSNVAPMSDDDIARRIGKRMATWMELKDELKRLEREGKSSWQIQEAMTRIQRDVAKIQRDHDRQVQAFENWLAAGRPNL
jgi:hypothetical protein